MKSLISRIIDLICLLVNKTITFCQKRAAEKIEISPYVKVGRYTYGVKHDTVMLVAAPHAPSVNIGSFCSIAPGVVILANVDHRTDLPSTYPFKTVMFAKKKWIDNSDGLNHEVKTSKPVVIGHDVWVGLNVIILSGVNIGTGAIIGAGAVVSKDIPPYAIAVGNPAKVVRYRFPIEVIEELLASEWWLLSDEEIFELRDSFFSENISQFLRDVRSINSCSDSVIRANVS